MPFKVEQYMWLLPGIFHQDKPLEKVTVVSPHDLKGFVLVRFADGRERNVGDLHLRSLDYKTDPTLQDKHFDVLRSNFKSLDGLRYIES